MVLCNVVGVTKQIVQKEVSMSEVSARKLAADFKIVMDDVEGLIKATASQTGERIGDLRQRLEKR